MKQVTRVRSRYVTPQLRTVTRDEVVAMVCRRLTTMNRILPDHGYMWALLYQRMFEGAEPLDCLHLANRYALGVCLREAVHVREQELGTPT
jgi:hypothetical protein